MTLADFFTLTEIKDGLSSPDRVEDLINIMRFENAKDLNNVEETSRQWSTVTKTIACTNNKECLECFVKLGGLCLVNTWLNTILKNASDILDGFTEESLLTLLQALKKLPLDDEKLCSTGVGITLTNLIVYSSPVIKERVHTLLDSWKLHTNVGEVDVDVKEDIPVNGGKKAGIKSNDSKSMESTVAEKVKDVPNEECSTEVATADSLDHEAVKDGKSVASHSTDLCTVKGNISISEPVSAELDTGITNAAIESCSNSKSEVVSLKQNVRVMTDEESRENGVTTNSVELSREDKENQPSNSCLPENEGSCLRSDDAKADKDATKAAQKDPLMAAAPDGIMEVDISETVCGGGAFQEKMQDGLAEQVIKSLTYTASSGKELSSDSITAKAEDESDGTEPSGANAVVQEAEIETRELLGFDLNEEVFSEDLDSAVVPNQDLKSDDIHQQVINHTSVATSVISASSPAASSGLPAGRLQFEGTLGWKGSAATSAFRPASLRKSLDIDRGASSNSLNQMQNVRGFDLNMVDDQSNDNTIDSVIVVSSSHPSEESCVEICPSNSKRAELDLNSLGDDAPPSAYWIANGNGLPFAQQNAYRSPSPASSSSSVHPSMWDLDLNRKFSVPNSEISILGARMDVGRDQPFLQSQLHPNGYSNSPSQPLRSFVYRPGIPVTVFDPRGSSIPSQHPYLMNMMMAAPPPSQALTGIAPPLYSSFDPTMIYMKDVPNQSEPRTRQYLMSTKGGYLEPHSTSISQPSSFLAKRKQPHSGWDSYNRGFKHRESPGKS